MPTLPAHAQQVQDPDVTGAANAYPAGVRVVKAPGGFRHVDERGRTLYMLDMQGALYRVGGAMNYCTTPECTSQFPVLAAPADAKPVGMWKPVKGSAGLQWTYKGSPVFTSVLDSRPGSTAAEFHDDMFLTIPWVPAEPKVTAPPTTRSIYHGGVWYLADLQGKPLFTRRGKATCQADCGAPFVASLTAHPIGDWQIVPSDDGQQWVYRGAVVFVAGSADAWPENKAQVPIKLKP